jgi:hypothetical protein
MVAIMMMVLVMILAPIVIVIAARAVMRMVMMVIIAVAGSTRISTMGHFRLSLSSASVIIGAGADTHGDAEGDTSVPLGLCERTPLAQAR